MLPRFSYAQLNFKTAKEESGIIYSNTHGLNIGYDVSGSEARFLYTRGVMPTRTFIRYKNGRIVEITPYLDPATIDISQVKDTVMKLSSRISNFKLAIPVTDGTNEIYSGGAFNPGLGLSYEFSSSKNEFGTNPVYYFIRMGYNIKENKFGSISSTDSISIHDKLSHTIGITPGINILFSGRNNHDNKILAFTTAIEYNVNAITGLKTKDYTLIDTSVSNGIITKTEKAYSASLPNFISVTPKIDFVWTPWLATDENKIEIGSRIGIVSSLSSKYNSRSGKFSWNYSIGPTLHPKFQTSTIVAALQAEFTDFNDTMGDKKFNDIFSVSFYIGIPLQLK